MDKKTILCSALLFAAITPFTTSSSHATIGISAENQIADNMTTNKIKSLYLQSPVIRDAHIKITTVNQNVVLSGQVKTKSQYERAITLVDSVEGVKAINVDNLTVKSSNKPLKDSYTTAKVKGMFLKEKIFGAKDIEYWPVNVETKDSVVYLTGNVSTNKERRNLVQLAQSVDGVKSVNSALTVKS